MTTSNSQSTLVFVAYRPKPGKQEDLIQLTREHVPLLRAQGLVGEGPVIAGLASDGTVVEAFEWLPGAVERAHSNPAVLQLWTRYADACEIVPLLALSESSTMFASFTPIRLT